MALAFFLTILDAQVIKRTEVSDGMGDVVSTTTATTLSRCCILQTNSFNKYMSDRVNRASSHVLVCEPSAYSWSQDDREITRGGLTYKIAGRPDNILDMDEMIVVPMDLQT